MANYMQKTKESNKNKKAEVGNIIRSMPTNRKTDLDSKLEEIAKEKKLKTAAKKTKAPTKKKATKPSKVEMFAPNQFAPIAPYPGHPLYQTKAHKKAMKVHRKIAAKAAKVAQKGQKLIKVKEPKAEAPKPWKILLTTFPSLKTKKKAQKLFDLLHRKESLVSNALTLKEKENLVILFNKIAPPQYGSLIYDIVRGPCKDVGYQLARCVDVTHAGVYAASSANSGLDSYIELVGKLRDAVVKQGRKW